MADNENYIDWKGWDSNSFTLTSDLEKAYFENIFRFIGLKKSSKILEIGFGNGGFLGYALSKNHQCDGVEVNKSLVNLALENKFSVFSSIYEIEDNKKYDLIVLFDVIEHIPEIEIKNFIKKLSTLLSKSGSIFLRFPNGASPLGLANQHGDITHCNIITLPKLNYWCQDTSLNIFLSRGSVLPFIFKHNHFKMPSKLLKLGLYKITERFIRFISSQSKGVLSSNLEVILKKKHES
jgi:2-polyprenyl-3-methyl-5-hydroxy-6-metoxy-1,4-benzoquinol methylase